MYVVSAVPFDPRPWPCDRRSSSEGTHLPCGAPGALLLAAALLALVSGCGRKASRGTEGSVAVATLLVVRPAVKVGEGSRSTLAPWESRVGSGTLVTTTSGRAWVHHDLGLRTLLGPGAEVRVGTTDLTLLRGRAWMEAPAGPPSTVRAGGAVVSAHRAGFELARSGAGKGVRLYVARGHAEIRLGSKLVEVRAGERAQVSGGKIRVLPERLWEDWTGGLAWPAPDVAPAPAGMGQIGARTPGSLGKASFPLALRSLSVKTRIRQDMATTVVDQVFFNPASQDLEGVYRLTVPAGAVLSSFCIDRPGPVGPRLVCGYAKEKQTARTQYRAQVYVGSTDDPALLEWEGPGRYKAHIYPIRAGSTRRVVIMYTEWLESDRGVRRWRYPMAGGGGAAPLIGEMSLEVDLTEAGAGRVEAGMGATVDRSTVTLRRSDFQPRSDFVLTLRGGERGGTRRGGARGFVSAGGGKDSTYVMVRLRPTELERAGEREGLDLVVVVDTSADTDPTELQLARTAVESLLRHLGPGDRVAVLGGDLGLRSPGGRKARLAKVTPALMDRTLEGLSRQSVGGATDLGQVLTEAAGLLQPGKGGAVVYVGDGVPTVGEMRAAPLLLRLSRLAHPVRVYGLAVGSDSNLALLETLARHQGGLAMRITDRAAAAAAALELAAHASRPVMSKVTVDMGSGVERVFPGRPVTVVSGEDLVVLGRLRGKVPTHVTLTGHYRGAERRRSYRVQVTRIKDSGELRRRWATARLHQLMASGAGREEVAELGTPFGLITEHVSFYVPSSREIRESAEVAGKTRAAAKVLDREVTIRRRLRRDKDEGKDKSEMESVAGALTANDDTKGKLVKKADRVTRVKKEGSTSSVTTGRVPHEAAARPGLVISMGPTGRAPRVQRKPARPQRKKALRARGWGRKGFSRSKPRPARVRTRGVAGGCGGGGQLRMRTLGLDGDKRGADPGRDRGPLGGLVGRSPSSRPTMAGLGDSRASRLDVHIYVHAKNKVHLPRRCSPASKRSLAARRILWRERLRRKPSLVGVAQVWLDAATHCELRQWRDRRALLRLMLDRLGSVPRMTSMARRSRRFFGWGDWAYLRRAIFARARTARDLALANRLFRPGRTVDMAMVRTMLARLETDADRLREVLALLASRRGNVPLQLMALHLLERAGRHPEAERLCSSVSGNPYADARLRTAVGEYWARQGRTTRAKRVFSEIVEFRPTDPLARRRLGDLYRAHGWFGEAYRQYQTLATLAPHDSSVLLLMAMAAAGIGRIDEALRLEQRVAASATGSGGAARWALLWSSIRLAKLRSDARKKGDKLLLAQLIARTRRMGVLRYARPLRVILTWSHPEADLELWGAHPGWRPQRAGELAPQFGIEAFALRKQKQGRYVFEVRRVGRRRPGLLAARVYVLFNEGSPTERLQAFSIQLKPETKVWRLAVSGAKVEVMK